MGTKVISFNEWKKTDFISFNRTMKGQIVTLMVHLVSNKGQVSCYSLTVCLFPRLQEAMSIADVTGQQLIQFVITAQYWERHRQLLWQTNNWKLHKLQGFWVFLEGFGVFEWFFFPTPLFSAYLVTVKVQRNSTQLFLRVWWLKGFLLD